MPKRPKQLDMFPEAPRSAPVAVVQANRKRALVLRSPNRPLSLSAYEEKHDARFYTLSSARAPGRVVRRVDHGSQR
ncbi:hypothetical protein [Apis mellifera associated microvirus 44]|nr:hypothetical protein [Apis mellifera associated microvirus 44]